ncbi:MAG TPA: sulfotransferase, partial [Caulobacteraceae bacterium]
EEAALALATRLEGAWARAAAAAAAHAKALRTLERRTKQAAVKDQAIEELRAKVEAARRQASDRQEQLKREAARNGALEEGASELRLEVEELSARLAEAAAERIQAATERAITIVAPGVAPKPDRAVRRIVKDLLPDRSESDDAAEYFRLGRMLQRHGSAELAAAAYREVGPRITELLAQPGPDGAPISGPDFLVIGAPRASTTWLKRALSHHPAIFILAGEPQFFSMTSALGPENYVARFAAKDARYLRRFRKELLWERPDVRFYGEKSTTYLSMPNAYISLCAALYPKARIICMVRDPIDRAWSHIKHEGLAHLADQPRRLYDQPYWSSLDQIIRHGRYERHLRRWGRHYPADQMLLVDFARVTADPGAVYREVLEHIGAEPAEDLPLAEQVGQTDRSEMPDQLRRILERAYANDRWDASWLRQVMERPKG